MIIVGSKALLQHFPNINREVNDIDIIGNGSDITYLINLLNPEVIKTTEYITSLININRSGIYDKNNVEILNSDASESLRNYVEYENNNKIDSNIKFASKEVLFSLKKSHINFPIKFDKHIKDYSILYDDLGGVDILKDNTKLNFKETENRVGKLKTPSLNKSTKMFFDQSNGYVKSFFIHDDIHKVMSHYDRPIYERMQKTADLAKCEKSMWELLSFEEKCKCVLEEAYVISLERKILPSILGGEKWISNNDAFNWSLMRICTTLCSGWFREFATNNYFRIKEYYNEDYVYKFLTAYNNGEINRNKS